MFSTCRSMSCSADLDHDNPQHWRYKVFCQTVTKYNACSQVKKQNKLSELKLNQKTEHFTFKVKKNYCIQKTELVLLQQKENIPNWRQTVKPKAALHHNDYFNFST